MRIALPDIFMEPGTARLYHILSRNAMIFRIKDSNFQKKKRTFQRVKCPAGLRNDSERIPTNFIIMGFLRGICPLSRGLGTESP